MSVPNFLSGLVEVYLNQIPFETDILRENLYQLIALSNLAQTILGTGNSNDTLVCGLICTPISPPGLSVVIGPGTLYNFTDLLPLEYGGDYGPDTTADHQQYKQCILTDSTPQLTPAPIGGGNSIIYLIECQSVTTQGNPTTSRPYFNSANPAVPTYLEAADTYVDVFTFRVKAGTAAPSPTPPTPDAGWTPLYYVQVANGQTSIISGNISVAANAPFITEGLQNKISAATGNTLYAPLNSSFFKNGVVNGNMAVAQREQGVAIAANTPLVVVDAVTSNVIGTSVSAGIYTQTAFFSAGSSQTALQFSGLSCISASPTTYNRIESNDSLMYVGQTASVSAIVQHNFGSNVTYTITVSKATVTNNFSAVTVIATSSGIIVPTGTATVISLPGISMGACQNGIEIKISTNALTATTKDFYFTDVQLNIGATIVPFLPETYEVNRNRCLRRFEMSYEDGTAFGTITAGGEGEKQNYVFSNVNFSYADTIYFKQDKVFEPPVSIYSPLTGDIDKVNFAGADYSINAADATIKNLALTTDSITAGNNFITYHWVAIADL